LPCGNVLYLSGDDAPERLKKRFVSRGTELSKIAFAPEGGLPQIGSPEMQQLFAQIEPTLCVIDTLQHFVSKASAGDMTAIARRSQSAATPLRGYAERCGRSAAQRRKR
jgi:predicted ATP-dependent serine protease